MCIRGWLIKFTNSTNIGLGQPFMELVSRSVILKMKNFKRVNLCNAISRSSSIP